MHSSRMRTARSLTVSFSIRARGGSDQPSPLVADSWNGDTPRKQNDTQA